MAEKKLTVRFATAGGQEVKTEMQGIGQAGVTAFGQVERATKSAADSATVFEAALDREEQSFRDLRASLDPAFAATQRYERAVEQATQAVRMGIATQEEANRVIAMARGRMDGLSAGADVVGRGMGGMRGQIQNAAFQIGDFATQVGAGTSASVALGQQLPQLLGGFGAIGALLGAGFAIGVPLLTAAFRDNEAAAKSVTESVRDLEEAMTALQAANEVYTAEGLQEQIDKYGELNSEILLLIERQRQYAVDRTILTASEAAAAFKNEMSGLLGLLAEYNAFTESGQSFPDDLAFAADAAADLSDEFGVTVEQAQALKDALDVAMQTDDPEAMADALATISGILEDSTMKGGEFAGALLDAESTLRQIVALGDGMGGWLGGAISQAATLATTLWDAARGAAAAAMLPAPPLPYAMPTGGPGTFPPGELPADAPPPMRPQARPNDIDWGYIPPPRSGGGSPGGGGSPVDEGLSPWFDPEQEQIVLDAMDAITEAQDRYNESVRDGAETVADLFTSIVDGSKSAKEALADLLAQMAQVQFQKALLGLSESGGFIGTAFSALSGALTVGSNAQGTDFWRGGPTWVGEQGPEIVNLPRGSQVIDAPTSRKMAQASEGGVTVTNHYTIDARGAEAGVEAKIARAIEAQNRMLPDIIKKVLRDPRKR